MVDAAVKTYLPDSLAEALDIRSRVNALPLAGGTDLMVRYRAKNGLEPSLPGPVMFVNHLPELRKIEISDSTLVLGASLPMALLAGDPGEHKAWILKAGGQGHKAAEALAAIPEVLRDAASALGAPALRQRAVLAGNVANASPAGDTVAALYALETEVVLESVSGKRRLPVSRFITGPGKTVLKPDELITAFHIPVEPSRWCYWRKVGTRRANALTKVSLASCALVKKGRVESFTLAYGAVGPTVVLVPAAQAMVEGCGAGRGIDIPAVVEEVRRTLNPIDDQRSTAKYRKQVALNLTTQALESLKEYMQRKQGDTA